MSRSMPQDLTINLSVRVADHAELVGLFEDAIRQAFVAGWQAYVPPDCLAPIRDADRAYEDWREYGPGGLLPGGRVYREAERIAAREKGI